MTDNLGSLWLGAVIGGIGTVAALWFFDHRGWLTSRDHDGNRGPIDWMDVFGAMAAGYVPLFALIVIGVVYLVR